MIQGKSVFRRIRNARNSLDNAERSFSSNQEIRGELDLMLAEAELQNLRQKRSRGMAWTRRTFAACIAALLLAAGSLGWWWASAYGEHTSPAASPSEGSYVASEQAKIKETEGLAKANGGVAVTHNKVGDKSLLPQTRSPATEEPAGATAAATVRNASASIQISSGQMRQLIRSGKQELSSTR